MTEQELERLEELENARAATNADPALRAMIEKGGGEG